MSNLFVIGEDEKPQCSACYKFFEPVGEYFERCKSRTKFSPDFPKLAESDPFAFCYERCEQATIDQMRITRIEDVKQSDF